MNFLSILSRTVDAFLRRAMPVFFLGCCCPLTPAVYGANTFTATGSLTRPGTRTLTLLPDGKVLAFGGWGTNESGGAGGLRTGELFDPATGQWSSAAAHPSAIFDGHTATLLRNGKVLIAGGAVDSSTTSRAALYDPVTDTWSSAGALPRRYRGHSATLLSDGKVFFVGGRHAEATRTTELYDPATGTWSDSPSNNIPVIDHTATLLADGRVLIAGGYDGFNVRANASIYDPANRVWSGTFDMLLARVEHTATLLPNGRVLVTGGNRGATLDSAELYNPATGTWIATAPMATRRANHTATLLPNGKVLVTGGRDTNLTDSISDSTASAEIFDPAGNGGAGSWSPAGNLIGKREDHGATLLADGKVLIAGGRDVTRLTPNPNATWSTSNPALAEIFDPATGVWSAPGSFATARDETSTTLLPGGKVLVAGGMDLSGNIASAELHDPATGTAAATGSLAAVRSGHSGTLLSDGRVLAAGGVGSTGALATAELYKPATGTWAATGSLTGARTAHTATQLQGGGVLMAGGLDNIGSIATAEIYTPATGLYSPTGSMLAVRSYHTATLLADGRVLVTGGQTAGGGFLASAEIFDPSTGSWTATGALAGARLYHTATLLPNRRVLIAGGVAASLVAGTELYDPATGLWTSGGTLAVPRRSHSAVLLPNGTVLVTGGFNGAALAGSEIYDPATGLWSTGSPLPFPRYGHNATLVHSGRILISGGRGFAGPLATSLLYDPGQGYATAWRPQITSAVLDAGGTLVVTGTGFNGISGASGGNSSQDSSSNFPLVQIRRLDNEQTVLIRPDPFTSFSGTSFTSKTPLPFSGVSPLLITVIANGIPATSRNLTALPGMVVEAPGAEVVTHGGAVSRYGSLNTPLSLSFTIRNTGFSDLTGLAITKGGAHPYEFTVTADPAVSVVPGGNTTFNVLVGTGSIATRSTILHIANNVPGINPFELTLVVQVVSNSTDSDGDGLADGVEAEMAALGFDWQVAQPALVNAFFSGANKAGFLTGAQIRALPGRFLAKDPVSGKFKMTLGVQKSANLTNFLDFPMNGPGRSATVNVQGRLEFNFTAPENASFYKLLTQ